MIRWLYFTLKCSFNVIKHVFCSKLLTVESRQRVARGPHSKVFRLPVCWKFFIVRYWEKKYQNDLKVYYTPIKLFENLTDRLHAGYASNGSPASTQHTEGDALGPHVADQCTLPRVWGPCPVQSGPRIAVVASSLRLTPLLTTRKRNQDSRAGKQVGKWRTCPIREKTKLTAGAGENLFTPSNTLSQVRSPARGESWSSSAGP